jgi:hypothetical protein
MASVMHTEATSAPAAAAPERKPASVARGVPEQMLTMQRSAGNAAVARMVSKPAGRVLQRCGAGGCTCGGKCGGGGGGGHSPEEELLEEQMGAGLLRSAVARRSA